MDKKVLIAYYSLTGNTQFIAEAIQEALQVDIEELKPVKELNPNSSMRFMWGGMQATMKMKPDLYPTGKNPLDYDIIFLGTPVWAWTFSPPLRKYISLFDLSTKKVAIWVCCAGDGKKALDRFKEAFKETQILGTNIFQQPLNNNSKKAKERAISWASEIVNKLS
ncbi:MAG: flavodoxin family protein [Candidatus Heimdallarchaeota archaeon]